MYMYNMNSNAIKHTHNTSKNSAKAKNMSTYTTKSIGKVKREPLSQTQIHQYFRQQAPATSASYESNINRDNNNTIDTIKKNVKLESDSQQQHDASVFIYGHNTTYLHDTIGNNHDNDDDDFEPVPFGNARRDPPGLVKRELATYIAPNRINNSSPNNQNLFRSIGYSPNNSSNKNMMQRRTVTSNSMLTQPLFWNQNQGGATTVSFRGVKRQLSSSILPTAAAAASGIGSSSSCSSSSNSRNVKPRMFSANFSGAEGSSKFQPIDLDADDHSTNVNYYDDYDGYPVGQQQESMPRKQQQPSPPLSDEQRHVVDLVLAGKSIFFTGSAGTGKSLVLREIIRRLPAETTYVTASTGIAAVNISGTTVHSFAGIGLGTASAEELARKCSRGYAAERWLSCETLIIDEVSMISGSLFEKLEYVARAVRQDERPFGGIQLVLCGDFFQLPPVVKQAKNTDDPDYDPDFRDFCFEVPAWHRCVEVSVKLTKVFRQQQDQEFVDMLNELRVGLCTRKTAERLYALQSVNGKNKNKNHNKNATSSNDNNSSNQQQQQPDDDDDDGIAYLRLYPLRKDVTEENYARLHQINSPMVTFEAMDSGEEPYLSQLVANCNAPTKLELKVGAQVMLLTNLEFAEGLVNGSQGRVVGFDEEANNFPIVRFACGVTRVIELASWTVEIKGKTVATRTQVPLMLAWALSIHKSQGMTLDRVEMSLANVFEYGQAYVALSRVRSLQGLCLQNFDPNKIKAHPLVIEFYNRMKDGSSECNINNNNNNKEIKKEEFPQQQRQ